MAVNDAKRKQLIIAIHAGKRALQLDDDTYRQLIATAANGQTSCTGCTKQQLSQVLDAMRQRGFANVPKPRVRPSADKAALTRKLMALLAAGNYPLAYADGMAQHMFKVERAEWLDAKQLWRLVAALEINARRQKRKEARS